jgi:hypothetical protein
MSETMRSDREPTPRASSFVTIEHWAEGTLDAIRNLSIAGPPPVRGTSVSLSIPLDTAQDSAQLDAAAAGPGAEGVPLPRTVPSRVPSRRELGRRDSLKRREALLKGKEGSRRRQRWENDRLIGNDARQPPLPSDWEVRPTYPVNHVPYYLASLWDMKRAEEERRAARSKRLSDTSPKDASGDIVGRVPKALKEKLRKSRGGKGLLQDLEREVRRFVEGWEAGHVEHPREIDSEDEDIVLVPRPVDDDFLQPEMMVFDGLEEDKSASFGRWLVHSIGQYYGLDTWSVTVGNPARREAYIGINTKRREGGDKQTVGSSLPRPLWTRV